MQTDKVHYIYEGPLVIEERGTNNLLQVTYTRGRDMSGSLNRAGGIGGLLARTDWTFGVTDYYHADAGGNVTAMINPAQVVTARYLYDPCGNTLAVVGARGELNRMRFSSKEANPDFNLVFYEYRTYDPVTQRWLQRDPIQENGGINLYCFVRNDPFNAVDPLGLRVTWFGGFRDNDVPSKERDCYNKCVQQLDVAPFVIGTNAGLAGGVLAGAAAGSIVPGIGNVAGGIIGGAGSVIGGWLGTYTSAAVIDAHCKGLCHLITCP